MPPDRHMVVAKETTRATLEVVMCYRDHLGGCFGSGGEWKPGTLKRLSGVIAVELKSDYHRIELKDPRAMNSCAPPWQGPRCRRHLGFRISHHRRMLAGPVSYPCCLLHSDPLDFADLGWHFLPDSRRQRGRNRELWCWRVRTGNMRGAPRRPRCLHCRDIDLETEDAQGLVRTRHRYV